MQIDRFDLVPNVAMVVKKVVRVRGGYLNRWLVRAEVDVPNPKVLVDYAHGRVFGHPETLQRIQDAVYERQCLAWTGAGVLPGDLRASLGMDHAHQA